MSVVARISAAATFDAAARSTNQFGLELYRQLGDSDANLCVSPYSISCALAMTLSGADGDTRAEMARVLHIESKSDPDASFGALQKSLEQMGANTAKIAAASKEHGGPTEPITIAVANRLFPQTGYDFRQEFFATIKANYGAVPEPLDYKHYSGTATRRINDWVADQTRGRIRDLIPQPLDPLTRLVLANAIYLKAPWANEFKDSATKPEPFHLSGKPAVDVPMMRATRNLGYMKEKGYVVVAIPYVGGDLQFVVFVPDAVNGVHAIERELDAPTLVRCSKLQPVEVDIHLPKFKLEPPTVALAAKLQALGMKMAFDIPPGAANFDRIAPRKPDDYLAVSQVFHKTFIAVDEKGTEAAAATAVAMYTTSMAVRKPTPPPIEIKVDRPFVYAIQHVPSGMCVFLGRVSDPR